MKGAPGRHDGEQVVLVLLPARAGLAIALLLAAPACVHDAFESPASRRTGSPTGGCARDSGEHIVILRARNECRAGSLDCTPALADSMAYFGKSLA